MAPSDSSTGEVLQTSTITSQLLILYDEYKKE